MTDTTNNNDYPEKLLNARTRSNFITIPHTSINQQEIHDILKDYPQTTYVITKTEQHEDGDHHLHIIIKFKQQVRLRTIHKMIMDFNDRTGKNGVIDYQTPKNINASIQYLKKEETSIEGLPYLEHGDKPLEQGRPMKVNEDLLDVLQLAQDGDADGALQAFKQTAPMDYIKYKNQIKETLKEEAKPKKLKYDLPDMNKDSIKLSPKQQEVYDLLQSTPKARRIIWVSGGYGSGKSFLYNYIKHNHAYGMYDAGQSASFDNTAYGYDEEGVIAWDLPRTFKFDDLGDSIAGSIEKFSDFGQSITSKKYSGKTQYVRGHVIVFSNSEPIDQLKHRDIIHIDLTEQPKELKDIPQKLTRDQITNNAFINKINESKTIIIKKKHKKPIQSQGFPHTETDTDDEEYMSDSDLLEEPMNSLILKKNPTLKKRWAYLKLQNNLDAL